MSQTATILLAEDNADDVVLMQLAFKKAGLPNPVHVVSNGDEAMEYLKGALEARNAGSAIPLLITLDLKMPHCDGFEVLAWVKKQPVFKDVPVLILSQSERPRDINRATHLGANAYLVKPSNFTGLVGMIEIFRKILNQAPSPKPPARKRKRVSKHAGGLKP